MPHPVFSFGAAVGALLTITNPTWGNEPSPTPPTVSTEQQLCWEPAPAGKQLVNVGLTRQLYLNPRDANGKQTATVRRLVHCSRPLKEKQ